MVVLSIRFVLHDCTQVVSLESRGVDTTNAQRFRLWYPGGSFPPLSALSPAMTVAHQKSAIILFSGLGSIDVAQESLSVGIGALAGSTIMLLTVPVRLCWTG